LVRSGAAFADAGEEWLRFIEQDRARKPSTVRDYRSALATSDRRLLPGGRAAAVFAASGFDPNPEVSSGVIGRSTLLLSDEWVTRRQQGAVEGPRSYGHASDAQFCSSHTCIENLPTELATSSNALMANGVTPENVREPARTMGERARDCRSGKPGTSL
jgi:hypothetical protein